VKRTASRFGLILALALIAWAATHLFWIFTENVNWDEFALLARAHDTLRTGTLSSGGRPGLATLLLIPFVEECRDAVQAARLARGLWTVFAITILAGLWGILRRLFEGRPRHAQDAALGVALLALTPAFLRYSLQVRTDQPAVALGLLGGLALLHSRRHPALAVLAGLLAGTGFLFSQKLIYVAALVGLLALGDALLRRDFEWSRDSIRVALAVLSAAVVVGVYPTVVSHFFEAPPLLPVSGQLDAFEFYRRTVGYGYYVLMSPELLPQLTLVFLLLVSTPRALSNGGADCGIAMLAWGILGLGFAVALFHAGAFPYFWITLGLFPAVGIAVGMPVIRGRARQSRRMAPLEFVVWAGLIVTAAFAGSSLSRDTQAVQRDTLQLVGANFAGSSEGFSTDRVLLCREDEDPFPVYFSQHIFERFSGRGAAETTTGFLDEFRYRPVTFMVESFRLDHFPDVVKDFWAEHYVQYAAGLLVPGISLDISNDSEATIFEVIVPGEYRLYGVESGAVATVDGVPLRDGETVLLDRGPHVVQAGSDTEGLLALSLPDPPDLPARQFFKRF
jgi:hypothetical protein